jgi:hypothetical protein
MKQPMREEMARRKAETIDPDVEDNYRYLGSSAEQARRPTEQPTRPTTPTPQVASEAEQSRFNKTSEAERWRGQALREQSQGARSGPVRGGGSGGGAGFKTNTGRKGAVPMPSDFSLNVYAKGGQVGKVGGFGLKRSKPDFAGGGSKTNFKMSTKKGDMPW